MASPFVKDSNFTSQRSTDRFSKSMFGVGRSMFSPLANDDAIKRLDDSYGKMFDSALGTNAMLGISRKSQGFGDLSSSIEGFSKNLQGFSPVRSGGALAGAADRLIGKYGGFFSQVGQGSQPQASTGQMSSLGGKWSAIDKWDSSISEATRRVQQETGVYVPPNVVKAIMMIETGGTGEMLAENYAGASGLMQITRQSMGASQYDFSRLQTDPNYNIWAGVTELALRYKDAKAQNASYDWSNVATGYFSGHYEPNGASDAWTSDHQYKSMFSSYLSELDSQVPSNGLNINSIAGPNGTQASGSVSYASFSNGQSFPITQEMGPTDFAMGAGAGMYGYGSAYGITGHPGIDIGMPAGTQLTTPWAGTVSCVGEEGPGGGGGGCGYYGDAGGGVGRIMITLDNGDVVIYGHTRSSTVRVGDRVSAGQTIGYSGGMNGDHLHLEYRQAGHNTPSGFKVIDPSNMSGMSAGSFASPSNSYQQQQYDPGQAVAGFGNGRSFGTPSWYGSYSPGSIGSRLRGGW